MKHITKLTIGLITIALVSYSKSESQISTDVSTQNSRSNPIITARQDTLSLNPIALNRLAENMTVEVVARSVVSGGDPFGSSGSGVIIGKEGSTYYVLSANHIFLYPNDYRVVVRSKKPGEDAEILKLEIIYRYPDADLAVFKFASVKQYKVAEIGEASQLRKNSQVYVGGWPGVENREGFQFTPAKVTNPRAGDFLTYEPTVSGEGVYPGMSGGAVLNEAGQLMGIHVGVTKKVDGDGKGVLVSTFLRDMPQQVSRVVVRSTRVALPSPRPSPIRKNPTVTNTNTDNITASQIQEAESYYDQGDEHHDREEFEQAIADLNQAIRLNPKLVKAYNVRGIVYYDQGKYDLAIADYNQAIQLNPKYAYAYYNRGLVYDDQGKYDLAIADYNQAIQLNPKDADYYYNRGIVYRKQGKYDLAIADYNQAIQLKPKFAEAYNNRGVVYYNQGKYDLAIADYNQAIQLNPKYAYAYNNRGIAYRNQGKYDLAIADYNQAIQLNPKYANAYYNRGLTYKAKRNIEKAISDFEKAADLYKQQADQQSYKDSLDQLKKLRGS
ncbi:MAG: tetratricopeptide repeat-containing serine protease family protein [Trichodesmium sp. MAG_R02]|nr:tetratricopeptide repeat-containing serine protease family protein [Trichodesmium sp. MAG_R02]